MNRIDLRVIMIAALLLLFPLLMNCGSDGVGFGSGFQNQFNPNPGGSSNLKTSCLATYALDATLDTTMSKNGTGTIDQTFYFVANSESLTLLSNTCPFQVENSYPHFEFASGRYIGPPLSNATAPLGSLTTSDVNVTGDIDRFGIFVNTAIIEGIATTVDPTHLTFTLLYPETPYWSVPTCTLSANVQDGNLEVVPSVLSGTTTPTQYHLTATFPVIIRHATDITHCNGVLPDQTP